MNLQLDRNQLAHLLDVLVEYQREYPSAQTTALINNIRVQLSDKKFAELRGEETTA